MKRKLLLCLLCSSLLLSGCSLESIMEGEGDPGHVGIVPEEEIEEGIYIMTADGEYLAPNTENQTFSGTVEQADYNRVTWVTGDDKEIPTVYADDTLVYFSLDQIPSYFLIERFTAVGYTFGIYGAQITTDGEVSITSESLLGDSDAATVLSPALSDGVLRLYELNGKRITEEDLSLCGSIKGLEQGEDYTVGVYKGTYFQEAEITADTKVFYSRNVDQTTALVPTKDDYYTITLPEMEKGYYSIDGTGLFYYNPDEVRGD